MKFRVVLKSGTEIIVSADSLSFTPGDDGSLREYNFEGVKGNSPCFIDINEIAAIVACTESKEETNKNDD